MATPGTHALAIYRGDGDGWTFSLWEDTAATVPVDLTGVVPKAEIRAEPGTVVLAELGCTVELPNLVHVSLAAADSAGLPVGRSMWDLQLTGGPFEVRTIVRGDATVTADITDSTGP